MVLFAMVLAAVVITPAPSAAQVRLSVGVNIGSQPVWGPVGYDNVNYYYFPDIDAYYYVPRHQFIYLDGRRWVFAASLPARYHDFDLYHSYKVVVNDRRPYMRAAFYRDRYRTYRGRHDQVVIRDSHEPRYFEVKDHPEHQKWVEQHKHDRHDDRHGDRSEERHKDRD